MSKLKCKKCGTEESDYWATETLCGYCRTFTFTRLNKGFRKPKVVEIHESDLTKAEEDLLYGNLVHYWNNNTRANRNKFLLLLSQQLNDKYSTEMGKS